MGYTYVAEGSTSYTLLKLDHARMYQSELWGSGPQHSQWANEKMTNQKMCFVRSALMR